MGILGFIACPLCGSDAQDSIDEAAGNLWDSTVDAVKGLGDIWIDIQKWQIETAFNILGFNDETIYLVNSSVVPLIPNVQKSILDTMILQHTTTNGNLRDIYQINNLTGVGNSADKFLAYGQSDYIYGVPKVTTWYTTLSQNAVEAVIESAAVENEAITIDSFALTKTFNIKNWVRWTMQEDAGIDYDFDNDTVTAAGEVYDYLGSTLDIGYDVELKRTEARTSTTYLEKTIVRVIGVSETHTYKEHTVITRDSPYTVISDTYGAGSTVEVYEDLGGVEGVTNTSLQSTNYTVDIYHDIGYQIPVIAEELYFTVVYEVDSNPGFQKIWMYRRDSGVYPSLDNITPDAGDASRMFPIIPIRQNGVDVNTDTNSALYKTTRDMLVLLGIDVDTYIDSIAGTPDEPNPDADKIEDATIHLALNVYTQTQAGIKGLYNWLSLWNITPDFTKAEFEAFPSELLGNCPGNTVSIDEQNYNNIFQYSYIDQTDSVAGVIGALGEFTAEWTILPNSATQTNVVYEDENDTTGTTIEYGNEIQSYLTIRYQYSLDEGDGESDLYREIVIKGLNSISFINTAIGDVKAEALVPLEDTEDNARRRAAFVIPLHSDQLFNMNVEEVQAVVYESMIMTVYAQDSVHLEYYETARFLKYFEIVMQAIAIIIFVISLPAGGSPGVILWELIKYLAVQYLIREILIKVLEHNLSGAGRAGAILLAALASYGNATSYIQNLGAVLSSADTLLLSVNAVLPQLQIDQAVQLEGLHKEMLLFENLTKSESEILQEAQDGLRAEQAQEDLLTGMDVISLDRNDFYESPDNFYIRTTHITNPGVLTLDQIETYHSDALKLPKLS